MKNSITRFFVSAALVLAAVQVACEPVGGGDNGDDDENWTGQQPGHDVLINGMRWAGYNVDAPGKFTTKFENPGMLYQFNVNVGWDANDLLVSVPGGAIFYSDHDVIEDLCKERWAFMNDPCPSGWHVPTKEEYETLTDLEKVKFISTRYNGYFGCMVVERATGNTIFFPNVGIREPGEDGGIFFGLDEDGAGAGINYWTASPLSPGSAWTLSPMQSSFDDIYYGEYNLNVEHANMGWWAFGVRCVKDYIGSM
jgi:uncharacterized protein (TIGR02145 family)